MAFEPVYSDLTPAYPVKLATGQAVIEARLPAAGFSLQKVLSVQADADITAGEVFAGEARYGGKVHFRALVLDSEGICRSLDYVADFSDKVTSEQITATTQPLWSGTVLDIDIVLATETELKAACVVEVQLTTVREQNLHVLTGGGEGVYTHDERLDYSRLSGRGNDTAHFGDTATVPASVELLASEARCCIHKRAAGSDLVSVEGVIINDLTLRGDGGICSHRLETPFTADLPCLGAHGSDICVVTAAVTAAHTEWTAGEAPTVACDYTLQFHYATYTEDVANPVTDAFSVTHALQITGENTTVWMPLCDDTFFERVEGKITLDDNMPLADKILAAVGARLGITDAKAGDGKLTVEGMVSASLIYASEEGQTASAAVELPFSLTVSAPLKSGDEVCAHGIVTAVNVRVRRSGELDVSADLAVEYSANRGVQTYLVTAMTQGEPRAIPTGAVAIHIARKGETLWDAAKALGTTPEDILLQNPGVTLPTEGGERIAVYRSLSDR